MNKNEAVNILRSVGWVINRPEDIVVTEAREDVIFLKQPGNGSWIVTESGSVTFFEEPE